MTTQFPQNPTTTDFLQENRFSFVLSKLPDTVYSCQKFTIPGVTLPAIAVPNLFSDMNVAGNKLEYQPTSLTFKVFENLSNWLEIYNWMAALGQPQRFGALKQLQEKNKDGTGEYSDMIVTVRTPKGNPGMQVHFHRCFPVSLGSLSLETDLSDVSYLTSTVDFAYTTFKIKTL